MRCYETLEHADFSMLLEISDHAFDAVISIGVYTRRFQQKFLKEMLRTLKPVGSMVFACRELYFHKVADSIRQLHAEKILR